VTHERDIAHMVTQSVTLADGAIVNAAPHAAAMLLEEVGRG